MTTQDIAMIVLAAAWPITVLFVSWLGKRAVNQIDRMCHEQNEHSKCLAIHDVHISNHSARLDNHGERIGTLERLRRINGFGENTNPGV